MNYIFITLKQMEQVTAQFVSTAIDLVNQESQEHRRVQLILQCLDLSVEYILSNIKKKSTKTLASVVLTKIRQIQDYMQHEDMDVDRRLEVWSRSVQEWMTEPQA